VSSLDYVLKIMELVFAALFSFMIIYMFYLLSLSNQLQKQQYVLIQSFVTYTEMAKKIEEGKAFSASNRLTIPAGESKDILIENKSGKNIKIVVVEITTLSNINIDIYDNVTVSSHGNKWDIRNLNLASTYIPNVTIEDSGSYSGGELVGKKLGYGGSPSRAIGSASEVGETVIIPNGNNIMIRITNIESQDTTVSVVILFYEDED